MGILDPADRNRLLSIHGLHKFVTRNERKYVSMVREWKELMASRPELVDPHVLAYTLKGVLMFEQGSSLFSVLWEIFHENEAEKLKYIEFIAKYFVDREAEG